MARIDPDRWEVDQFDNENAVHMFAVKHGQLLGYQRMLPTTKPYLLTEVLQDLCVSRSERMRGNNMSVVANTRTAILNVTQASSKNGGVSVTIPSSLNTEIRPSFLN